uniref:DNA-directed RNA polymerase subunit beta n=1 Tax=Cajanus cajan TaxID=3821 RepID=A0A151RMG6_CAJCA|nr:DNA-directed RNA polymerase subunit beta'' [Cajanus cajan]
MIPVGIGFKRIMHRSKSMQYTKITLETKKNNLFKEKMRDILSHHRELFISKNLCDKSEQSRT